MSKVTIELNSDGIKKLLQSQEVMGALENVAQGLGEIKEEFVGFDRCHVIVEEN